MASFNRVILLANVTRDIDVKVLQSGTSVAEVGLAVNDRIKRGEEWVDEVTFVDVTFFGRTAEICGEYLSKGSQVLVEGRLKLDTWEKDGKKNYKLRVIGEQLKMVGGKKDGGGSSQEQPAAKTQPRQQAQPAASAPVEEDIPFAPNIV